MQDLRKLLRLSGTAGHCALVPLKSCELDSQTAFFLHKLVKFLKGGELVSLNTHDLSDSLGLHL